MLAHAHGARLKLVHDLDPAGCKPLRDWCSPSIDIELKAAQAWESLRRFAVEIAGRYDVSASVEVMVGDPLETLMRVSERAELFVLGRRGHSRFKALLVGRTGDRLLRTCRRPVLVVRKPVERDCRRVLVPVDFTAHSDAAVQFAARLTRDGDLYVLHAINSHREAMLRDSDVPEHLIRESRLRQEAGALARMRRKAARPQGRKAARLGLESAGTSFALAHGHPVWSILSCAQRLGCGADRRWQAGTTTLAELLPGSVSRRVLAEAACDMLIVPRPRTEPLAHATSPQLRPAQPTAERALSGRVA